MNADRATRTQALVDHLRQQIAEARIAPGGRLPSENELVAEHGVSRTVVREALLRLQTAGFIYTRRGKGSYALAPPSGEAGHGTEPVARSLEDRVHLLTFRMAIESEAAALCAGTATEATFMKLSHDIEEFENVSHRPAQAMSCDYAFHLAIAEASGNPFIAHAVRSLGPAMITMPALRFESERRSGADFEKNIQRVVTEHRLILGAISDNDVLGAYTAMRSHLLNSRCRLKQV